MQIDTSITLFLNQLVGLTAWSDSLILFFASYFDIVLVFVAILFLFIHDDFPKLKYFSKTEFFDRLKNIILAFSTSILAWCIAQYIKNFILRPRPFLVIPEINALFAYGGFDSFPSGHATLLSALALSLYFRHKRIGILFGIGAILVSFARVISGIHYFGDIVGGFALGIIVACGIEFLFKMYKKGNK